MSTVALALICQMHRVSPLLDSPSDFAVSVEVKVSGSHADVGATPGVRISKTLRASRLQRNAIKISGAKTEMGFPTWAILSPTNDNNGYRLEWQMVGEYAKDGPHTIAVWQLGNCGPLARERIVQ